MELRRLCFLTEGVGSGQMVVDSWQLAVDSWQLTFDSWQWAVGS